MNTIFITIHSHTKTGMKLIATKWLIVIAACLISPMTAQAQSTVKFKGGGEMYYEDSGGSGDVVLFLHGHTLDRRMWDGQVAVLKDNYRIVVPDLRGYGKSSDPEEGYQFTHADDVIALMDSLGIDRAHVVGLSLGAYVAGDLVALFPNRLLSCVMVSGETCTFAGPGKPRSANDIADRRKNIAQVKNNVNAYKQRRVRGLLNACHPANRDKIHPELTREIMDWGAWQALHVPARVYYGEQAWAQLKSHKSDVPSLIIYGASERTSKGYSLPYLTDGKLIQFKQCGHMVNLEQPEKFNNTLVKWLKEHSNSATETLERQQLNPK